MAGPGHWRCEIYERDNHSRSVKGWLGDSPPTPSDGGGGWEAVTLPKGGAVTIWRNRPIMRMAVPFVMGAVTVGDPVQPDRQVLVNMYRPDDPQDEPPVVKINSIGDAIPFQQLDWIIDNLEWGDAEADGDMNRVLQHFTLTLMEYRPDVRISTAAAISAAKNQRQKAHKKSGTKARGPKSYVVKAGDTLSSIAKRLKIGGGWRAIGDIQKPPITDPRAVHVGQKLRLP